MKASSDRRLAGLLTAARVILLPLLLLGVARDRWLVSLALLVVMGLTDLLDGPAAQCAVGEGALGALFDLGADFALVFSVSFLLYRKGQFPLALPLLMAFSFFLFCAACLVRQEVVAHRYGKYTGAVCLVCLGAVFLAESARRRLASSCCSWRKPC